MFRYRARLCTRPACQRAASSPSSTHCTSTPRCSPRCSVSAAREDRARRSVRRALAGAGGAPLGNVFDTAIAARFLGFAATGLASLLSQLFAVQLPKHMQQADWGARPLSSEAIALPRKRRALPARAARPVARARARRRHRGRAARGVRLRALRGAAQRAGAVSVLARPGCLRTSAQRARAPVRAGVGARRHRARARPAGRACGAQRFAAALRRARVPQHGASSSAACPTRFRAYAPRFAAALAQAEGRDDAPHEELFEQHVAPPAVSSPVASAAESC